MRLKITLTCWLTLLASFTFAQPDTLQVNLWANWQKGKTYRYKVTKTKSEQRNQDPAKNTTESYLVNVVVEDSTESGYLLNWQMGEMLAGKKKTTPELDKVLSRYRNLELKYQTDADGIFTGLVNWQEFGKLMNEVFDETIKATPGPESVNMAKALEPIRQALSSREGIENVAFKEIQVFHYPYGVSLVQYDTISYDDELANMFGGNPIKANGKLYLSAIDQQRETCQLVNTLQLDQADVRTMVTGLVESMSKAAKFKNKKERKAKMAEIQREMGNMEIDIRDERQLEMNYRTMMPNHIVSSRFTTVKNKGEQVLKTEAIKIEAVN